jgi:hypothetical protein
LQPVRIFRIFNYYIDGAGRVPGQVAESLDGVLAYIQGREQETYLEK